MTNVIPQRLSEKISSLPQNVVAVLKGVPLSFVDDKNFPAALDAANKNPLDYFMRLTAGGRKFFTHEEFILLSPANLFVELYPIAANFCDATKKFYSTTSPNPNLKSTSPKRKILMTFQGLSIFLLG